MSLAEFPDFVPLHIPANSITSLDEFQAWTNSPEFPEKWRVTYIDGEVLFEMSPERFAIHTKIKYCIAGALEDLIQKEAIGYLIGDGPQLINKVSSISTQPDALFCRWETLRSGRLQADKAPLENALGFIGTPDWVLEVVSATSIKKDKELLRAAYWKAGIPEYWVIDALGEEIDFALLVHNEDGYRAVDAQDGWLASPTFGHAFKLERTPDQLGFWRYTLHRLDA